MKYFNRSDAVVFTLHPKYAHVVQNIPDQVIPEGEALNY
jgi:hypothetical protein